MRGSASKETQERLGSRTRRIGTQEHFRWLERIIYAILILNVFDAFLTLYWVSTRQAIEWNPLMASLIEAHPVLFVLVKCTLVSLGSFLLWRHRKRPLAVISVFGAFLAYYWLLLYHLNAAQLRLFRRWFE
ncbi:MAG: hypothetical protein IT384_30400 [Deltaproteobacteria bacterium]|nr:hypothetical protein [Deltaproteobacteria bacterium]